VSDFDTWFDREYPKGDDGRRTKYHESMVMTLMIDAWQASRRAALEEAHTVCLAGVKWSPEPTKHVQFYVNGTCHRLAAEISQLAKETNNG
jgi:hypothetical protein